MKKITRIRMSFAFLLLVLLLAMLIVVVPDAAVAAQDGDYTYTLGGRPIVATITKYTGTGGAIAIPSTLGGYATAAIGEYAFWNCGNVTSVTIPVSVTSIGDAAFMKCTSLTAIDVLRGNPSYESVGGVLYNKTDSLVQYPGGRSGPFIMPNTVTSIGDRAFAQCTLLTSVAIGEKVVSIGAWAFLECTGLTSVTIPDSVTTIGREAFRYCTWTTSMVVGRNVTSIGQDAFNYCTHLTSLSFLGMIAPIDVGVDWIRDTPWGLRGHAFTASNFPNPGEDFRGLLMGTVIPAVPGIPANISALPGNGQVALNWTAPSDDGGRTIDSYVICQDGVILPTVVFDTSANITGLTNGQTYSFSIAAHNSMGNGTCSPAIVITPATVPSMPQNVAASAGPNKVIISWQAPASNGGSPISGYKIYRSLSSGMQLLANISFSALNYEDTTGTPGTTYIYQVQAVNSAGVGAISIPVGAASQGDNAMVFLAIAISTVVILAIAVALLIRRKGKGV